jgi:thiol:disulfide interchange protein DsbC
VRGNGLRKVAVFSDPSCSYCKRLEPELAGLDNITVYTFLVPFQGLDKPIAVWCAADREQAWQRLMLQGDASLLNASAVCDHPVDRNLALAHRLGVQGTPTLIWANGARSEGYVERAVLEARLNQATQDVRP